MSRRKKVALVSIVTILTIPILVTLFVLQNPPWVHSPIIRNAQALVSTAVLANFDVVDIPDGQELYPVTKIKAQKLEALKEGEIKILAADEISSADFKEPSGFDDRFVIATIDPVDVEGKAIAEKRRLIEAVDKLAINGKIDLIVEATASDAARANAWGLSGVKQLDEAGAIRCVIFDGGHHVNTLPLQPDIILLPVIKHGGEDYASHWYTRDSVHIQELKKMLVAEDIKVVLATFPRSGIPVKNPSGMALIAKQAILKITEEAERTSGDEEILPLNRTAPSGSVGERSSSVNKSLFVWVKASPGETKEDILEQVSGEVDKQKKNGREVERIYAGVTFGMSRFPHVSKKVEFDGEELEKFLNEKIPHKVTVLTEPFSTWDIYLEKLTPR